MSKSNKRQRRLEIWSGRPGTDDEAVKLTLDNALYSPPNPDRTRKACRNCVLWLAEQEACFIHDSDVTVLPDMVCGYHVYGEPMLQAPLRENMAPVTPELSGLEQVPEGSSCDGCTHYNPAGETGGVCQALWQDADGESSHPDVQALGCCAAWQEKS